LEVIVTHPSRISIVLPLALAVVWIALICLALPGFALAGGPAERHSEDRVAAISPGGESWREVR
jgi:hypothetical protein